MLEIAKKSNEKDLIKFLEEVLSVYEKYDINGHIIWKKDSRNKDSKSIRRNEVLRDRQMDIIQSMRHKENTIGEFRIATTRGLLYDNRRIHTDRMVSEPSTTRGLLYLQYTTYCKFCQVKYK